MKRIALFSVFLVFLITSVWAQPNLFDPLKIVGNLDYYDGAFYVAGTELQLGNGSQKGEDYNGDGMIHSIAQELLALRGSHVAISGFRDRNPEKYDKIHVTHINGIFFDNPKCKH